MNACSRTNSLALIGDPLPKSPRPSAAQRSRLLLGTFHHPRGVLNHPTIEIKLKGTKRGNVAFDPPRS